MANVTANKNKDALSIDLFNNEQIDLFSNFLCNTDAQAQNLSNTIDFWDLIPVFSATPALMSKLRTYDGYLPPLEHEFSNNKESYKIKILPAIIKDADGEDRAYYPSSNESIIEDVLRKLATKNQGFFDSKNSTCGVVFTIYQIKEELRELGRTRSHTEIVRSLDILSKSHIQITNADGRGISSSNILSSLSSVSKTDYATDPSSKWVITFHPLVAKSIGSITYRQFNYNKMMLQTSQLGRWMHKRLSHCYINASLTVPYTVLFSTILNDSKLLTCIRKKDNINRLESIFNELKDSSVILHWHRERTDFNKTRERGKPSIEDILYKITPHPTFVGEVKAANKRKSMALESMGSD